MRNADMRKAPCGPPAALPTHNREAAYRRAAAPTRGSGFERAFFTIVVRILTSSRGFLERRSRGGLQRPSGSNYSGSSQ